MSFDPNKSLQQLEGKDWGEPTHDSNLVTECHRLRRVPLCEFTAENLRIMIGQQIGLPYLLQARAPGDCILPHAERTLIQQIAKSFRPPKSGVALRFPPQSKTRMGGR